MPTTETRPELLAQPIRIENGGAERREIDWNKTLQGALVPLITPSKDGTTVDEEGLRELINKLAGTGGVDAILACVTTGEDKYLTPEQRVQVIRTTVAQARETLPDKPVIAGVNHPDMETTIELAIAAAAAGADAVMLTPTIIAGADEDLAILVAGQVEASSGLKVLLYDAAGEIPVSPRVFDETVSRDIAIGIKETSKNVDRLGTIVDIANRHQAAGRPCVVAQGAIDMLGPSLQLGITACASRYTNIDPLAVHDVIFDPDPTEVDRIVRDSGAYAQIGSIKSWYGFKPFTNTGSPYHHNPPQAMAA